MQADVILMILEGIEGVALVTGCIALSALAIREAESFIEGRKELVASTYYNDEARRLVERTGSKQAARESIERLTSAVEKQTNDVSHK